MPVLLPLALNIGFYLEFLIPYFKDLKSKKETLPVYINFGLIGTIGITFPVMVLFFLALKDLFDWILFSIASLAYMTIGVLIFKYLYRKAIGKVIALCFGIMLVSGWLALPLIASQRQTGYNPLSDLQKSNLPVYSLGSVSPEAIWDYGSKLPQLQNDEGLSIPDEQQFYLVTGFQEDLSGTRLLELYSVDEKTVYDLNFSEEGSRGYKTRLKNDVYLLNRN